MNIKPLEFIFDDLTGYQTAEAIPGTYYNIRETMINGWCWRCGENTFLDVRTEAEAKAACWKDWIARITQGLVSC